MYNATTPGEVVAGNLPSTLRLRNAENTGYISLSVSGTTYGDTTNGVIFENNTWAIYRNSIKTTRSCLFTEADYNSSTGIVKDDFPDQVFYTSIVYFYTGATSGVLNRAGLCAWESPETFEGYYSYYLPLNTPVVMLIYGYLEEKCPIWSDGSGLQRGPSWWDGYAGILPWAKFGNGGVISGPYHISYPSMFCSSDDFSDYESFGTPIQVSE
jgi:hypothetical protein